MRFYYLFLSIGILFAINSCTSDFDTTINNENLVFSKNTIVLDTVFDKISSKNYQLKVYNNSNSNVTIPSVRLGKGGNSRYRITVDGTVENSEKLFKDVVLLAKDSLSVFIEITLSESDVSTNEISYTDEILFESSSGFQKVTLISFLKKATLLYPDRLADGSKETITINNTNFEGFYLNDNELHFTNEKAYLIYGYAAVPEGKTVVFDPGARVYFYANSGLLISKGATIEVNGSKSNTSALENEVIFQGNRLEPEYTNISGQWSGVWLGNGAVRNVINNLTIKNASIGLHIQTSETTTIKNSQIYNSTKYGILAENGKIIAENTVINKAGLASLFCSYGGNYSFTHCTLNNNWNSLNQVALALSNSRLTSSSDTNSLINATFNNCILYGSNPSELILYKNNAALFEYQFNNCLIRYDNTNSADNLLYNFYTDITHYNSILLNRDPKFKNVDKHNLSIYEISPIVGKGNPNYLIPLDILGNTRTSPPDLGAYQNSKMAN